MKRVLFVLLGLSVALTVAGLLFAFARPIRWPANIATQEWRHALDEKVELGVEEAVA